jgi:hypothetical protein
MTIDILLATYREAFIAADVDAIGACFASPCVFVSERVGEGPVVLPSDPVASRIRVGQILDWNRRLGVARLSSQMRWSLELSPRQACRHLHVVAQDKAGAALYAFDGVYTFAMFDRQWRIAAISHNQIPAMVARVQATNAPEA